VAATFEDLDHNTTRFFASMSAPELDQTRPQAETIWLTTFVFSVRNIPAALLQGLGRLDDECAVK